MTAKGARGASGAARSGDGASDVRADVHADVQTAFARLFLDALGASGVRDVVLSPGSRSTPLALAAAATASLRTHVIVDERSAAFFALGQARGSGRPTALVCTSGTAGAHYLPALIEASQARVPLVAITADRPWELQGVFAPQTIDQAGLFGAFVRHFADVGQPDPSPGALRAARWVAARAVARSLHPDPGPVHLNMHFRKPLEPLARGAEPFSPLAAALRERPPTAAPAPRVLPDPALTRELARALAEAERPLFVCGPRLGAPVAGERERGSRDLLALAAAASVPVFAEATSGARFFPAPEGTLRISGLEWLLRSEGASELEPDLVVEFGAPPTSTAYAAALGRWNRARRFVVAPFGWPDPAGSADALLVASTEAAASALAAELEALGGSRPGGARRAWLEAWREADARALEAVQSALGPPGEQGEAAGEAELSEADVARAVVAGAPEGSALFVGNSLAVRHLDAWVPARGNGPDVFHQRGASGIDGLVAGAAGLASARKGAVTLLLGDVSLLHDVGSLALLAGVEGPLVVVAIQNGGGRIFEGLPVREAVDDAAFERLFATPTRVDFGKAAEAFGIAYCRVGNRGELAHALERGHARRGAWLVEAVVPPGDQRARARRALGALGELWGKGRPA